MLIELCAGAQLGPEQAKSAVQAAMAAASATLQQKRVEVLIPPQAADWLQVTSLTMA